MINTRHYTMPHRSYYAHVSTHTKVIYIQGIQYTNEKMQTHNDNKMSYSLSSSNSCLYTDANKYCNILLKMHISTMFSSPRVCSCQNHGPKLSVSRLGWGRPLRLKQLPCLAGNVFTVFVPLRCTACLIHHNQTVMQLQYVSTVYISRCPSVWGVCCYASACVFCTGGREKTI